QQLAARAARGKPGDRECGGLERAVINCFARRDRPFVRSLWKMEFFGMAWPRTQDTYLSLTWHRSADSSSAGVRVVFSGHGSTFSDSNVGWSCFAALPCRTVRFLWPRPGQSNSLQLGTHLACAISDLLGCHLVSGVRNLSRADDWRARTQNPEVAG